MHESFLGVTTTLEYEYVVIAIDVIANHIYGHYNDLQALNIALAFYIRYEVQNSYGSDLKHQKMPNKNKLTL